MIYNKAKWLILSLLSLCVSLVSAQSVTDNTALPLDPAVKTGKLSNGFTYYIRKNAEPKNRVTLYLANKVGSILESDNQQGLAHFLEHMSFNGTKHFPKNELVSYLQKAGVRFGGDLNAYTSFDETVYQLPLPTDNAELLNNGFLIMRDWAHNLLLDSLEIDKERGVILEEKRLGKNAQQRMKDQYLPMLLNQSMYSKRMPIGTEEVLKNFKKATIQSFYNDWYRPDLQALIVVGDIDVATIEKKIVDMFSDLKVPEQARKRTEYTIPLIEKNQFMAVTDKEFPATVLQVLIKHQASETKTISDYRNGIIRSLFNRVLGSRINELTKQSNPPFIQGGVSIGSFLANLDVASVQVVSKPGELEKGFKALWTEIERVKEYGFTQTELDRAKAVLLKSAESINNEKDKTKSEAYVKEYLNLFLKNDPAPGVEFEYTYCKNNLKDILLSEVNALATKYLVDVNRDVILLASDADAASLPTEVVVNSWISDVRKSKITAYVDNVSDKPLLKTLPVPGQIVSEKKRETIGVTEFKLSNGVKVIVKPTDFKNDELIFNAYSPGGTSLYSDADYESAARASALVNYGGLADYSLIQLSKYLSGKKIAVSPYIGERTEGFSGYSSIKDFETALQIIYLYFTNARKDLDVYNGVLTQEKANLANRSKDPESVFSDSVAAVLGNYNIRRTGPSLEKIAKINLSKSFDIYKERFADASDFTFTFVGNIDLEKIKPLLNQYLAALPSLKRVEKAKDLGIHIPTGKIKKEIFNGQDQKSTVRLTFSGDYKYSEIENNSLNKLSEVLTIKLIERLREQESGVYGVGAKASWNKYPTSRYSFSISFGCAPENTEKLIASTLDEIKKLQLNGCEQADIDKIVAEGLRSNELRLKDNGFWINYLSGKYQNNENPEAILNYTKILKNTSSDIIKESASKYLKGDNFIQLIQYPENKQ